MLVLYWKFMPKYSSTHYICSIIPNDSIFKNRILTNTHHSKPNCLDYNHTP